MCPEPGPRDLFLVILVNGRHINFHAVTEYSKLRNALEQWATEYKCHIKMLPMGGDELMNYLNIAQCDPQPIENMDPEFRAQAVQNCLDSLRDSLEPDERDQALDLLRALGVLNA